MDVLDLVQPHCPPTPVFSSLAVFDALDTLVAEGRIAAYGSAWKLASRR
jgi:aryl-alcohol dehydrogenase-like predicted oxidoreductase